MVGAFAVLPKDIITDVVTIGPPCPADLDDISEIDGAWAQLAGDQQEAFESTTSTLVVSRTDYADSLRFIKNSRIAIVKFENCRDTRCVDSAIFRTILQCPTVRNVSAKNCSFSSEVVARDACIEFAKKPGFLQFSGERSFPEFTADEDESQCFDVFPEFGQILQHWLDLATFPTHMTRFAFTSRGRAFGLNWFSKYGMKNDDGTDCFFNFYRSHPNDKTKRIEIYCVEYFENNVYDNEQLVEMCLVSVQASVAVEFGEYSSFEYQNDELYEEIDDDTKS